MSANNDSMASSPVTDFFLPDLCQAQSILFLVLVSELLAFVQVLFSSNLFDFDWVALGLASLFIQWIVLVSAALLCNIRPWLMGMSVPTATSVAYGLILLLTLLFSLVAEMVLGLVTPIPLATACLRTYELTIDGCTLPISHHRIATVIHCCYRGSY